MDMKIIGTYVAFFEDARREYLVGKKPDTLYKPIEDLLRRGGKRLRPVLCLMSCELFGKDIKKAIPTAMGIEFFHNFSLVHDDIEDDSKLRRGDKTLHVKYGIPIAINAGDGLYSLCYEALRGNIKELGIERAWKIFEKMVDVSVQLAEGQAMDLEFKERRYMTEEEAIEQIRKKTGKLFAASAKCGAIAGGASYEIAEELGSAWEDIGIAFQIRDDILNIKGEEDKYGKKIGEDLVEGKPSLLLIHCLQHYDNSEKEKIYREKSKIEELVNLFKKHGSIEYSEEIARRYLSMGVEKIRRIKGKEKIKEKMIVLAKYFVERKR